MLDLHVFPHTKTDTVANCSHIYGGFKCVLGAAALTYVDLVT